MARTKKEPNRVDDLLDELLEDCHSPEDILGESGLMKQIKKRLVERALAGELNHHLKSASLGRLCHRLEAGAAPNSRNGSSKKTVQSEDGELELSIPRDRRGSFEPILVPKHQRRIAGLDEKILALYSQRQQHARHQRSARRTLWGSEDISSGHQRRDRKRQWGRQGVAVQAA